VISVSRKATLLFGVLAFTLLALACGGGKKEETKATTAPSTQVAATAAAATQAAATAAASPGAAGRPADAAPDDQQIFRASASEPQYLDPHRSSFAADISVERMLFRGLFQLDKDGKPAPAMATELPTTQNGGISADGKTYTIKLKPGLKFSDGSPLTAKDFEYSMKRALSPEIAGDYAFLLGNFEGAEAYMSSKATGAELEAVAAKVGVKAKDDATLEIKIVNVEPTLLIKLAEWAAFPVKKDIVEKEKEKAFTEGGKLVGNGPYMLKEYKLKESMTLVPNPNWALTPKPLLKEIRLRFIDDAERAFDAFRNNELDVMWDTPASKLAQIKADSTLKTQYLQQRSPETRGLHLNQKVKPLDNVKVRMALAKAIDRETLNKVVFQEKYTPTTQWVPAGVSGIAATTYDEQKFDVAAAKKLLEEAGFPNGQGFPKLKLVLRDNKELKDLGEFLKTDYKKNLGIDIDLDIVDSKTRSTRFQKGDFELFFGGWIQDFPDVENWIDSLWDTGGGNNHSAYSNAELDAKLKANKFEPNTEKRLAAYKEMNDIVNKTVAIANMYHGSLNYMIKPKVAGYTPTNNDAALPGDWNAEAWYIKKT
jgi:oligopeptide transport system substrate-binding protein